jgi:hypothetical protein
MLNNIRLETSRYVAFTEFSVHMEKLLKCCCPWLRLNQLVEAVTVLLLNDHIVYDHTSSHLIHGLNIPCSSRVAHNSPRACTKYSLVIFPARLLPLSKSF